MANQKHWERFERDRDEARTIAARGPFAVALGDEYYALRCIKWWWQRITRGYDDPEIWDLRHATTRFIQPRLKEFARWQSEHGERLPTAFATDPAGWLEALNKMVRAFELLDEHDGLLPESLQEEVAEGLQLFAKHYNDLVG